MSLQAGRLASLQAEREDSMYRLIDYMAILSGGVFVGILAAYAARQIWAETLKPFLLALGGD